MKFVRFPVLGEYHGKVTGRSDNTYVASRGDEYINLSHVLGFYFASGYLQNGNRQKYTYFRGHGAGGYGVCWRVPLTPEEVYELIQGTKLWDGEKLVSTIPEPPPPPKSGLPVGLRTLEMEPQESEMQGAPSPSTLPKGLQALEMEPED